MGRWLVLSVTWAILTAGITTLVAQTKEVRSKPTTMERNWFDGDRRKIHIMMVVPEWTKGRGEKMDPARLANQLATIGARTVEFYIKDHHGVVYYPSRVGGGQGPNLLKNLARELKSRGMRFVPYYSVCWDKWVRDHHPEWAVQGDFASKLIQNIRGQFGEGTNVSQPVNVASNSGYRQYVLAQLEEIAVEAGNDFDGVWLDIFPVDDPVLLQECIDVVRKHKPDALFTFNGAGAPIRSSTDQNFEVASKLVGWSATERHAPNYAGEAAMGAYLRYAGKPFEIFSLNWEMDNWASWSPLPPFVMEVAAAIVGMHGGTMTTVLTPLPDGSIMQSQVDAVAELFRWIEPREKWWIGAESAAEIAILMPRDHFQPGLEDLYPALSELHVPSDFCDVDQLSRYRLAILPEAVTLTADRVGKVRRWVQQGGKLILFGKSVQPLEDLAGLRYRGTSSYHVGWMELRETGLRKGMPADPALFLGYPTRVEMAGGEVLGTIWRPEANYESENRFFGWSTWNPPFEDTGDPAISRNRFGSGEVLYCAAPFVESLKTIRGYRGGMWARHLLGNMIEALLPDPQFSLVAPTGVWCMLNSKEGRHYLDLVEIASVSEPTRHPSREEELPTVTGLALRLNERRLGTVKLVRLLPGGREVPFERREEALTLKVPDFKIHAALEISH
jgi:alpha-L-fucosidase